MSSANLTPIELTRLHQWVCWRYETRGDKRTKPPINAKSNGKPENQSAALAAAVGPPGDATNIVIRSVIQWTLECADYALDTRVLSCLRA